VKERGAKKRLEKKKADGKRRLGGRGRSRLTGSTGVDLAEHELTKKEQKESVAAGLRSDSREARRGTVG
jgi:hypothetical protein